MSTAGFIGVIVLVVISLFGFALPFLQQRQRDALSGKRVMAQKARDELLTTYERVLATIRDLDEDHHTGKLAPDVYQRERSYWTEKGILLLQQLEPDSDNAQAQVEAAAQRHLSDNEEPDAVLDDAIEQAIAAYRQAQSGASA